VLACLGAVPELAGDAVGTGDVEVGEEDAIAVRAEPARDRLAQTAGRAVTMTVRVTPPRRECAASRP
jgi:hypothetical protein